jgi:hypothetical protein
VTSLQEMIVKERDAFFARVGRMVLQEDPACVAVLVRPHDSAGPVEPLQNGERFTKLDDGCVLDHTTGLIWSPTLDCGKVKHGAAEKQIAKLNADKLGGRSDWRLPHVRELHGLVDFERTDPAIDKDAFPDTKSDWYWSGTPFAGDSSCAWGVNFGGGGASWYHRSGDGFVRAVRGPLAPAGQ